MCGGFICYLFLPIVAVVCLADVVSCLFKFVVCGVIVSRVFTVVMLFVVVWRFWWVLVGVCFLRVFVVCGWVWLL